MISDYVKFIQAWCKLKILLWNKQSRAIFKERDIWWCKIGVNIGEELYGKGATFTRPVLVFKKFTSNSFLGLPLTKQAKKGSWYVEITMHGKINWVILNQARVFDKKRFSTKIGTLDDEDCMKVKEKVLDFYKS